MIDITHKSRTLRTAVAQAKVYMSPKTLEAVQRGEVPKGDVLEVSRTVGMLAVKRVPDLLPYCHPIAVEQAEILIAVESDGLRIEAEIACIDRTGVEVEAMTAASVAALNAYDMLKPLDKNVRIGEIHLVRKSGGRSDFDEQFATPPRAAILVTSDAVSEGKKEDRAGHAVRERLEVEGLAVGFYEVVPDEPDVIAKRVGDWAQNGEFDLILTVGGTGLGPRDRTVEAVRGLLEREIPGLAEAMRSYGMERTPYAALSRGIAGQIGTTLVLTLPGSTRGSVESLDGLLPWMLHIFRVFEKGYRHEA